MDRRIAYHPNDPSFRQDVKGKVVWLVPNGKFHLPVELGSEDFTVEGHRSIVNSVLFHPQLPIIATAGVEKIVRLHSPFPMLNSGDVSEQLPKSTRVPRTSSRPRSLSIFHAFEDDEHLDEDTAVLSEFDFLLITESGTDMLWRTNYDSSATSSSSGSSESIMYNASDEGEDDEEAEDGTETSSSNGSDDDGTHPLVLSVWRQPTSIAPAEESEQLNTGRRESGLEEIEQPLTSNAETSSSNSHERHGDDNDNTPKGRRKTTTLTRRPRASETSDDGGTSECSYCEDSEDVWDVLDKSVSPMPNPATLVSKENIEDSDDEFERVFVSTETHESFANAKRAMEHIAFGQRSARILESGRTEGVQHGVLHSEDDDEGYMFGLQALLRTLSVWKTRV
ncbi:hypothetical protein BC829DRAFT_241826 [Chytridium lagenaria]|nr:hypothetical protein BC829DRAFT_241826 [Chytridium lagenaria]